ncbi:hypothetical protein KSD_22910 [Ktedonobacter sp. SOSP1-85]|nr:hypothetical protein KSD_22910 [Ktedonobacter sp. SOSP1-85]
MYNIRIRSIHILTSYMGYMLCDSELATPARYHTAYKTTRCKQGIFANNVDYFTDKKGFFVYNL